MTRTKLSQLFALATVAALLSATPLLAQNGPPPRGGDDRGERGERGERGDRRGPPGEGRPGGGRFGGPGGPPDGPERVEMMRRFNPLFAALDADKDGSISSAELENATTALKTLDKDGDDSLSMEIGRAHV